MNIKHALRDAVFKGYTKLLGDSAGMVVVPTLSGPNQGHRFKLDLMRHVEAAYFYGTYDKVILQTAGSLNLAGKVVWDCGIYLGFYTVFFAQQVGSRGRVIAFEPDPDNLARSQFNCAINDLSNVAFRQVAIGAPLGETDLAISRIKTNSHLPGAYIGNSKMDYAGDQHINRIIKVPCISLDQALADETVPRPDLIKIDIEGAEFLALDHMNNIGRQIRPTIILELHNPECDQKAWEFAQRYHYRLTLIDEMKPISRVEDVHGTLLCEPLT